MTHEVKFFLKVSWRLADKGKTVPGTLDSLMPFTNREQVDEPNAKMKLSA